MMFGFSGQRRRLLEAELMRMAGEIPALGGRGTLLVHDVLGAEPVDPGTGLHLVVIHETDQPFHRRADFFTSHLRPQVGTQFYVYTPEEYETLGESDPLLRQALHHGHVIDEPA